MASPDPPVPLTIQTAQDRLHAVLASIADVEAELAQCAAGSSTSDGKAQRVGELTTKVNEYINRLQGLHAALVDGGIVKDTKTGATETTLTEDGAHVEIPVEVMDYLDQGKNPDEAMRLVFGSVLKRGQEVKGKEQALRAFSAAVKATGQSVSKTDQ